MHPLKGIYEHFACHRIVPVPIAEVQGYILDLGIVADIQIFEERLQSKKSRGYIQVFDERNDGGEVSRIARVVYSAELSKEWRNLVVCKELLHILDEDDDMAASREGVQYLLENLLLPKLADLPPSVRSDHNGQLHALMILFPRDYLYDIRPEYVSGNRKLEEIAEAVNLPIPYVRVALSDVWQRILEDYI